MKGDQLTLQKLDHDEREILLYLEKEKPYLLEHFKNHIVRGRNGILHRFISSIIRENMMNEKNNIIKVYNPQFQTQRFLNHSRSSRRIYSPPRDL